MPTMAEQAGLRPVSMAEAAGLTPVDAPTAPQPPQNSDEPAIGPTKEGAKNLPQLPLSTWDRFKRGMLDIGQGVNQRVTQLEDAMGRGPEHQPKIWDFEKKAFVPQNIKQDPSSAEYTASVLPELQDYEARIKAQGGGTNVPMLGKVDLPRAAGSAVATLPAMALGPEGGLLAKVGAGAVQGAAGGFSQFDPENNIGNVLRNTGQGALVGSVLNPTISLGAIGGRKAIQAVGGKIRGAEAAMNGAGTLDDLKTQVPQIAELPIAAQGDFLKDAQAQIRASGGFDAEGMARKANLIKNGLTPTKSMVTRDPADWSRERNLQKLSQSPEESISSVGRDLTSVYQGNDAALGKRLDTLGAGLPKGTMEQQGQAAMVAADKLAKSSQEEVGKIYTDIRATHGDQLASDAHNVVDTLHNPDIADNAYSEPIINSVTKRLKRYGMIGEDGKPTSNTMTVTQADEFRKFLQTLKSGDAKTDRIVTSFIRATDQDVLSGAGTDVMSPARQAASARFDTLANPGVQRALNALGELNQGKTAQNFIQTNVVNAADQDVHSLLDALSKSPETAGARAHIEAGVMQHLRGEAINPTSGKFSGAALNKALEDLGDTKLKLIFGSERAQQLRDLARAGVDATYEPPYSAVNHSGTTPMLLSAIRGGRAALGINIPVVNQAAENMAAGSGYRQQLAEVMAAHGNRKLPALPPAANSIGRALAKPVPVAAAALATGQRRK